ncbi:unnamed protein product [Ambrosiozyma monospora]|uniref:Unnamed protein product n=1 Tax=Ambrosiozyma monospora TaxID=43982 RepID=A0A9W6Z385_AMBMO|nr:unnamed protein product [Ambrosiozyma monospora]
MTSTINQHKLEHWLGNPRNKAFWNESLVHIRPSPHGGLGVFAAKDIKIDPHQHDKEDLNEDPDEGLLLRIDKSCILSPQTSFISNLLYDAQIDGMYALVLAFLYEKSLGAKSPWFDYVSTIQFTDPESGKLNLPCCLWDQKLQDKLTGTEAELMGVCDTEELEEHFTISLQFAKDNANVVGIPPELDLSLEDDKNGGSAKENNEKKYHQFAAITMALASRAFTIDAFHQLALVPGADLFNHDSYGEEDVHFEALGDVCPFCGKLDECGHGEFGAPDSEDELMDIDEEEDKEARVNDESDNDDTNADKQDLDDKEEDDDEDEEIDEITEDYVKRVEAELEAERLAELEDDDDMEEGSDGEKDGDDNEDDDDQDEDDSDDDLPEEELMLDPDTCCDIIWFCCAQ